MNFLWRPFPRKPTTKNHPKIMENSDSKIRDKVWDEILEIRETFVLQLFGPQNVCQGFGLVFFRCQFSADNVDGRFGSRKRIPKNLASQVSQSPHETMV